MVAFAYYLSYRLRFGGAEFAIFFKVFLRSLPAVIACKLVAFFIIGAYRGIWGYMSSNDVSVYIKASTVGSLLSIVTETYLFRFEHFSKGIFVIDWLLTTAALLGSRGFFRLTSDFMKRKTLGGERVLIYGAGRGGEILLREVLNNRRLKVEPVGFIDDDPVKTGKKLQGFPVLGTSDDLEALVDKHRVSGLVVSFADMPTERLEKLRRFCRRRERRLKRFRLTLADRATIA
jgi:UDP-GlcNAc:undecaprenyl-phosphate GlcNAc-1-phosphate transferase